MFIITIPIQTHAVKLDLPVDTGDMTPPPIDPVKNKIVVEPNGTILWNGAPVDPVTLRQYLDITTTMTPTPELHLQPHPQARYEVVDPVLAITKRANVTAMGFVGNEARSEERRVGKECVSTGRYRWSPEPENKKITHKT